MKRSNRLLAYPLQGAAAVILAFAGVSKLTGDPGSVEMFARLGMEPFGRYLVGGLECVAALILILPYAAAWGGVLAWGLMTGALIAHATRLGVSGNMLPFAAAALAIWIASSAILYLRREEIGFVRCMFERE